MKGRNRPEKALFILLTLLLFICALPCTSVAQVSNPNIPLVYDVENTGASFVPPSFPDKAHLPIIRPLPDPFVFFSDGQRRTDFGSWEQRRNEIKSAMENFELGPKPDCADCTITATWVPATAPTRGTLTINVTRTVNGSPVTISIPTRCYIPAGTPPDGGYAANIPAVTSAGTSGFGAGSLGATTSFAGLTMASCDFPASVVTTYGGPKRTDNFYKLYPDLCAGNNTSACTAAIGFPNGANSSQYAAWSWGVSRVIDGIKIATQQATNPLPINMHKLMVTGCSWAGKLAMYAGAFDERIALTVAQENGGGGGASWRAATQLEADDKVENLDHTDHNWFRQSMWDYQGNDVYKLPHDHHELMAMVAPRAMLETGNMDYLWLNNMSNTISGRATQKIFEALGIGDRYGFYIDSGHGHCSMPASQAPTVNAWIKKYLFYDNTQNTDTHVTALNASSFATIDYNRWTAWWGTSNPAFPNDWNPGSTNANAISPGSVVLSMPTSVPVNFGDTLRVGYDLMKPDGHLAATVTLNNSTPTINGVAVLQNDASMQADITCPDNTSYTLTAPFTKASYTIAANDNNWYPSDGSDYEASVTNNLPGACNGGVVTNCVFTARGTQTTRGAGNAGGPGFTDTDTNSPLNVRYHITNDGAVGSWSNATTVLFKPYVAGTVQIIGSATLTKNADGTFQAVIKLKDNGTGTAQYVKVTSVTLGASATPTTLPLEVGSIAPGATVQTTVTFPADAGVSGTGTVLRIVGNYAIGTTGQYLNGASSGGSFTSSVRTVVP